MRIRIPVVALLSLAVFVVGGYFIGDYVRDKLDEANAAAGYENIPSEPSEIEGSQSLYRADNFGAALSALEERAGQNPELLKVGVHPWMAEFQVKEGKQAKGYRYHAKNGQMGEFKVKLVGPGSLEGSQFPYRTVSAGVTEKLAAAVAKRDGALRVTYMMIEGGLIDGDPVWSVNAESDERTGIVFQADPDGSGLADPTQRALDRSGADNGSTDGSAANDAPSQAACVQQAGGDVAKVQACVE
jgi:hypothetical protein